MITGRTIVKRDVLDKPVSGNIIFSIDANVIVTATENKLQWLHLTGGGWVNAGVQQQYIEWHVVPDPLVPAAAPADTTMITELKRRGRIATLLVDWQNPKWGFEPRQVGPLSAYPHTVTFNAIGDRRKGARIPLTTPILDYLGRLNGTRIKEKILQPAAGWINIPTVPPTIERLSWAANHVIVKESKLQFDVDNSRMMEYSNVHASSCYATDLNGTFFDKDMRLIVHKFNAVTHRRTMIKLTRSFDCYTPFITDPDLMNGDMWIRSDFLEMWPDLPFKLADGTKIVEYELHGFNTLGLRADGSSVVLRDPKGFKTNWKINSPEIPV